MTNRETPKDFLNEVRRLSRELNGLVQNSGTAWERTESIRQGEDNRIAAIEKKNRELTDRLSAAETRIGLIRSALDKLSDGGMSLFQFAQEADGALKL